MPRASLMQRYQTRYGHSRDAELPRLQVGIALPGQTLIQNGSVSS